MTEKKELAPNRYEELLKVLKNRFEKNKNRHPYIDWSCVESKLTPEKLWSLDEMEQTGGEPDVVDFGDENGGYAFADCSPETPKGRCSVCYDREALESRKEHQPKHSATGMADEMGVELLDERQYHNLQRVGNFDTKTSSWLKTPSEIRKLGGAIFGDFRYGRVFVYHNGAESYYAVRGFRGLLTI